MAIYLCSLAPLKKKRGSKSQTTHFRDFVPAIYVDYSKLEREVKNWVRADDKGKEKIQTRMFNIIHGPAAAEGRGRPKKRTKTEVRIMD